MRNRDHRLSMRLCCIVLMSSLIVAHVLRSSLQASNVFSALCSTLCKSAIPLQGPMTNNHILALRCLLEGLQCFKGRTDLVQALLAQKLSTPQQQTAGSGQPEKDVKQAGEEPQEAAELQLLGELLMKRRFKRLMSDCVEEFNKKPAKGIARLAETFGLFSTFGRLKVRGFRRIAVFSAVTRC